MGTDKLSLEVGGMPLIHRVHHALAANCREILVVGGQGTRMQGARRVAGERPGAQGPLAGLEAGLAAARNPLVFVAAGDMPFLTENVVGYLLRYLERNRLTAVVPRHRGRTHPLCAAYDREILPKVGAALDGGVRAVRDVLKGLDQVEYVGDELRRFGDPDRLLLNVNTPEDLKRARDAAAR